MRRTLLGSAWLGLYLFIVLAPILLMLVPPVPTGRTFWVELSVALGFVGLTQIGIQFILIARFQPLTYPYGIDVVLKYHRQIAVVALAFVLIHPFLILLEHPARIRAWFNPLGGTYASKFGLAAVLLLLALTVTSIWREALKIRYETWRKLHTGLGVLALVFAQVHVSLAGLYVNTFWKQVIWIVSSVLMVSLIVYLRLVKPALQRRRPWRVVGVRKEGGQSVNVDIEAVGHDGFRFHPGQFAWIKVSDSPFTMEETPLLLRLQRGMHEPALLWGQGTGGTSPKGYRPSRRALRSTSTGRTVRFPSTAPRRPATYSSPAASASPP